jgi:hypothetical protein
MAVDRLSIVSKGAVAWWRVLDSALICSVSQLALLGVQLLGMLVKAVPLKAFDQQGQLADFGAQPDVVPLRRNAMDTDNCYDGSIWKTRLSKLKMKAVLCEFKQKSGVFSPIPDAPLNRRPMSTKSYFY